MENVSPEQQNTPPPLSAQDKGWLGIVFILLSAFFFSLMSIFVRLSGDLPTFQKSFFRNIVASVVAFIALARSKNFRLQKGSFGVLLLRSVAGTVGIVANFYAVDKLTIADASILNKLAPFFSIVFSALLLKEKASWKDWLLVVTAFCGALFVIKPSFSIAQSGPALIGALGGLGAGLAYTCVHYLGGKGERTAMIVFFFSTFSCLAVLPFTIAQYQPMTLPQLGFLLLAGGCASVAQFSVTKAYTYAPAKDVSVYDYSQVLFSALWGFALFGEIPDWLSFIGYTVIISSAVIKYLLSRKNRKDIGQVRNKQIKPNSHGAYFYRRSATCPFLKRGAKKLNNFLTAFLL